MSVAADYDVEAAGFRVEVELFKVVQNVDRDILKFDDCSERKGRGPGLGVHVAANGEDGCDGFELVEDGRVAHVASVNDGLGAFERGEGLRAEEAMGIGDDAEEERLHGTARLAQRLTFARLQVTYLGLAMFLCFPRDIGAREICAAAAPNPRNHRRRRTLTILSAAHSIFSAPGDVAR